MKALALCYFLSLTAWSASSANFKVKPGKLHTKGNISVSILPEQEKYQVQIHYDLKKKSLVPVPAKLLKGEKTMEFPPEFRTEAGYKKLAAVKSMEVPKAVLRYLGRADIGDLKQAYILEVLPTNKKSKIKVTYHPSLPATGWLAVKITFLSPFPILDGYEVLAELQR